MKKVLQQTLFRLKAFLLLAVMFIVGSSAAWAQDGFTLVKFSGQGLTVPYGNGNPFNPLTQDGVTISGTGWSGTINLYSSHPLTISCPEYDIRKIELINYNGNLIQDGASANVGTYAGGTWTGNSHEVIISTTSDFFVYAVNVYIDKNSGSSGGDAPATVESTLNFDSWNLSYSGGSSKPASATHFNNGEVFSNAEGVTMTLTNIPNPQSWPSECFYSNPSGSTMALYLCNGEGFTIAAPSGYTLNKIVVNRASTSYSMTSLIIDGVQNNDGTKGTWTGEAESVAFSTISGNDTKRILVSNIQVTLVPVVDEGEVTYTIDITNAAGANVTICGETVVGSIYTATKTLQNSDVVVTGAPAGYKAEVTIANETITITWVEIPKTSITSYSDAPGTYSLDDKTDGFNNFKIYFADNFAENYTYQNLPQLLNWTLPSGASAGGYPYANSGSNELTVTLNNANVAGDYHLTIPAGTLSFEDGKTNPAIDLTWTLTAASMFSIGYDDTEATGVEGSNYAMKTLTGFNITAPDGVVFDYLSSSNCSVKLQGMYDPSISDYPLTDVVADWTLENGVVSIRFAEPYTVEGNYYFRIGEGAIVATDGRSNKSFNVSATVDPHDYFDFTFNETEFEGAFNTFTLTLPEGVTAASIGEFEASYWDNAANKTLRFTISDAEFTQTGRQLAVNFTAPAIPVDQNFSVIFEEGSIATTDANQISNYKPVYNLHVRPVRMHFVKMGVDSDTNSIERGAMIEEVTTLFVCFDEPIAAGDDQWLSAAQAGATLTDANGNDVGFYSGSFYCVNYGSNGDNAVLFAKLSQTVSTPGVYTFHLPANVYTSTNGHKNEAVEFTFEIGAMPLEITNVSFSATEGGVAMPITVNFSQKVMLAEEYEGNVYLQKKTESGYVDVTLDNYGRTTISDYYYNGWYGDVTYYNYAYINLYDADGSYGSFHSLEAGDYRLVIDKDIFTSVKGTKLEADYYYDFTVTAVPSAAVAGALDGKYYGTYYASRNWIVPEGVTAYYIDAVNNGELHLVKIADAGGVVNGSIGVLLESTEAIAKAPIAYTSQNGGIWANDNMLRGTTADQLITNDSWDIQYKYYMLSRKNGVVGFYWDPSTSDEGESLNNKANKAYLRVPVGTAAASALRIVVDENELTCIDSVAGVDSNADIYDLQGKRVVAPKGGVYVKNGKKFIVK